MTVEFKQDGQEVKIKNIHQVIYDELYKCVDCYDDHGKCKYNIDLNDVKWFTTYDTTSSEITEDHTELNIKNNEDCDKMDNPIEKTKKYIDYKIGEIEKRRGFGESLYLNIDELKVISKALNMYLDFTNNQHKAAIQMGLTSDKK